ncbi:unnamed protein product [Cyclocybe aegerita]|uniref:Uncharacterized protein n=1 Tax=Cyclocybe aegerita TaxID=1973307 RepID=A0A8S0WBE7_CYCAE|nr:unnamed protein product [Cyclocybe aegerita]
MFSTDYLTILRQCVNLENCCLWPAICDDMMAEDYQKPLLLKRLKRLTFKTDQPPSLIPSALECPALEVATVHYEREVEDGESGELMSFFQRCGKTLCKLQLPGLACYTFKDIQQSLQALEELTISGPLGCLGSDEPSQDPDYTRKAYEDGSNYFFEPLITHPEYLPRLKTLRTINQRMEEKFLLECLLSGFVEARLWKKNGGSELQEVVFGLSKEASEKRREFRKKWKQWRNNGIRITFN